MAEITKVNVIIRKFVRPNEHDETYILLFTDEQRTNAIRQLGKWASDPDLAFSWHHAAEACREMRRR